MLERKVLFFVERELHLPLLKPVMEYIYKNRLGKIGIFSFNYNSSDGTIVQSGLRAETVKKEIDFDIELIENPYKFKPDFTFMADFSYHFVEGLGKIINIGHGTISKGWFFSERNISRRENCADLICVPGTIHKEILSKQVFKPIAVTGMPKLDRLFTSNWDRKIELEKLGLDPDKKTVLFAPTFNQELSIVPSIMFDLHKYIPSFLNIIIKLHGAATDEWYRNYEQFAQTHQNVCLANDLDITKYLYLGNVLISDVSSVIFEFASTNKPVLCYDSPTQNQYVNYHEDDIEYKYRDVGTRFNNVNNLKELLFKVLSTTNQVNEISQKFVSVTDGTSAEKVVQSAFALEDKKEATIIIDNCSEAKKDELRNKYANKFYLNFINKIEKQNSNSMEIFADYVTKSQTDIVFYYDAQFILSPQLPSLMLAHFVYNKNCGIVVPLKPNNGDISQQNIQYYIKQAQNMTDYNIGFQITYSNPGISRDITFPENMMFAIDKTKLTFDSNLNNDKSFWFDLLKQITNIDRKILLAFDTYIYVDDRPVNLPVDEEYEKQVEADDEVTRANSVFENTDFSGENFGAKSLVNSIEIDEDDSEEIDEEYQLKLELENDPFNIATLKKLIYLYLKKEKFDSAETFANMLPDDQEAILISALSLEKQNLIDLAYDKIKLITNIDDFNNRLKVLYYVSFAKIKMKKNMMFDVESDIVKALNLSPQNVEALITAGTYNILKRDMKTALIHLDKAISLSPNNIKVNFGRGLVLQNLGKFEEAFDHFYFCVDKNVEDLNSMNALINCAFNIGKLAEAQIFVDKYLQIHPQDTNMLFVNANLLFKLSRFIEANISSSKLIQLDSDFKGAKELQQDIKKNL